MFISTDVKMHTGVQRLESFSPQLHASSFRCRIDELSVGIFKKTLSGVAALRDVQSVGALSCSVVCRVRSVRLATAILISDEANPASTGRLVVFVGFRQPVIIRQVSFSVAFCFVAWLELSDTGKRTLQLSSIALERAT